MRTTILVPNRESTEYGQLNREEKWSNEDFESEEEEDDKLKTRFRLIFIMINYLGNFSFFIRDSITLKIRREALILGPQ